MSAIGAPVTLLSRLRRDKLSAKTGLITGVLIPTTAFKRSVIIVGASDPQNEQAESDAAFTSQEDLGYLWRLGAGSVISAAAIKYGSVLFPAITKPNIVEAMIIIFVPVIVALLLLYNQSSVEK